MEELHSKIQNQYEETKLALAKVKAQNQQPTNNLVDEFPVVLSPIPNEQGSSNSERENPLEVLD